MHKKDARKRKKLVSQIRHHRVTADGRVLTADGRETLLGNLAPVKHIPMLPWKRVIVFPTIETKLTVSTVGENSWFYELLKATSEKEHDLIGFTPVDELDASRFETIGAGSVGMAVQVREVEEPENDKAIVHLKGICRYETAGLLPSADDHFSINIRWFEDNREADSLVRPQFEQCLSIIERLSKAVGRGLYDSLVSSKIYRYEFTAAQYLSFVMYHTFGEWFTEEEDWEMLRSRSTAARLKKINEHSKKHLPAMEKRFKKAAKERMKDEE